MKIADNKAATIALKETEDNVIVIDSSLVLHCCFNYRVIRGLIKAYLTILFFF
jgi:hypothetical protein